MTRVTISNLALSVGHFFSRMKFSIVYQSGGSARDEANQMNLAVQRWRFSQQGKDLDTT